MSNTPLETLADYLDAAQDLVKLQRERIRELEEVAGFAAIVCQRAQVQGDVNDQEVFELACALTVAKIPAPGQLEYEWSVREEVWRRAFQHEGTADGTSAAGKDGTQ